LNNAENTLKYHDFMNYDLIPTTVFSKIEYCYVGLTEEEAA